MKAKMDDLGVGDEITITYAPQKIAPVQYHNFDIGPFSCTTRVRDGETAAEAAARAYAFCEKVAREAYPKARDDFFERVKDSYQAAKDSNRR